jgi:Nuclear pore protein 84 / 107
VWIQTLTGVKLNFSNKLQKMDLERSLQQLNDSIAKKNLIRPRTRNLRDETMDFESSRRRFDESSLMTSASVYGSQTNLSVIVKQKTDHLYHHFLSVIQSRSNEMEIFETVYELQHVLETTIDEMQSSKGMKVGSDAWIRQEMNTWNLIHCLYKDRLITQKEEMETDDLPLVNSEKIIVEHLYLSKFHNHTKRGNFYSITNTSNRRQLNTSRASTYS